MVTGQRTPLMLTFTRAQKRFFLFIAVMAFGMPGVLHLLHGHAEQQLPLYEFVSTEGPFSAMAMPDAGGVRYTAGVPISTIPPGGTFTFINNMTVEPGTLACTYFALTYAPTADGLHDRVVQSPTFCVHPDERRSGPKTFAITVPGDAPVGSYELRRPTRFTGPDGRVQNETFPPVRIQVVAPAK